MPKGLLTVDRANVLRWRGGRSIPPGDAHDAYWRAGKYAERYATPIQPCCSSYFKTTHQTPGTTVALPGIGAFSSTSVAALIYNTSLTKSLIMDYLKFLFTPSGCGLFIAVALASDETNRYSSGGTSFTPQNANSSSSDASVATVYVGNITLSSPGANVRYLGNHAFNTGSSGTMFSPMECSFCGDRWIGGGAASPSGGSYYPFRNHAPIGGLVVGPQKMLAVHVWYGVASTPTTEFEFAWWEQ